MAAAVDYDWQLLQVELNVFSNCQYSYKYASFHSGILVIQS